MNVRKVKKYGAEQLEHIRNAVDLDPAIFEKFVQLTRNEEETLEGERGTLALEKESKPRPVDAFHYAMYRRAAVDQNGAFPARGIILPLYYHFTAEDDTRTEEQDQDERQKADTLLEQITILQEKRAVDYCKEMKADPAAILEDLNGYISKMSKKDFPGISQAGTAPPEPAEYNDVYLNVWGVIIDGAAALRLIEADTEENRDTLHAAIDKAARKLSGQLPPEKGAPRFDFPDKIGAESSFALPTQPKTTDLISIAARRVNKMNYPTDKINFIAWNLPGREIDGQLRFDGEFKFNVGKNGSTKALVLYNIHFDESSVTISKKLEPYDKRVQMAAGTLWEEFGEYFTLKQLYHAMGYDGAPGSKDFERISDSLKKQLLAEIQISNEDEAKKQKKRAKFVYSGALLPYETVTAIVNGTIQDGVIHLLREPPMIEFARKRKQITAIPRAALTTPLSLTNSNIAIEDYVIERVNMMKHNQDTSRKMLISSVNEHCLITDKRQKQRTKGKLTKLLEYYKKIGYIKDFTPFADAFELEI